MTDVDIGRAVQVSLERNLKTHLNIIIQQQFSEVIGLPHEADYNLEVRMMGFLLREEEVHNGEIAALQNELKATQLRWQQERRQKNRLEAVWTTHKKEMMHLVGSLEEEIGKNMRLLEKNAELSRAVDSTAQQLEQERASVTAWREKTFIEECQKQIVQQKLTELQRELANIEGSLIEQLDEANIRRAHCEVFAYQALHCTSARLENMSTRIALRDEARQLFSVLLAVTQLAQVQQTSPTEIQPNSQEPISIQSDYQQCIRELHVLIDQKFTLLNSSYKEEEIKLKATLSNLKCELAQIQTDCLNLTKKTDEMLLEKDKVRLKESMRHSEVMSNLQAEITVLRQSNVAAQRQCSRRLLKCKELEEMISFLTLPRRDEGASVWVQTEEQLPVLMHSQREKQNCVNSSNSGMSCSCKREIGVLNDILNYMMNQLKGFTAEGVREGSWASMESRKREDFMSKAFCESAKQARSQNQRRIHQFCQRIPKCRNLIRDFSLVTEHFVGKLDSTLSF